MNTRSISSSQAADVSPQDCETGLHGSRAVSYHASFSEGSHM